MVSRNEKTFYAIAFPVPITDLCDLCEKIENAGYEITDKIMVGMAAKSGIASAGGPVSAMPQFAVIGRVRALTRPEISLD